MDILYAIICLFFLILIILYIRRKKGYIKDREGNTEIVNPIDTAMLIKAYMVMLVLFILVLYFIFRE